MMVNLEDVKKAIDEGKTVVINAKIDGTIHSIEKGSVLVNNEFVEKGHRQGSL